MNDLSVIGRWPGEITLYGRGDGTWTALGYESIEDWLQQTGAAAVVVVPAEQLRGAVEAIRVLLDNADDATDDAMLVRRSDMRRLRTLVDFGGQ